MALHFESLKTFEKGSMFQWLRDIVSPRPTAAQEFIGSHPGLHLRCANFSPSDEYERLKNLPSDQLKLLMEHRVEEVQAALMAAAHAAVGSPVTASYGMVSVFVDEERVKAANSSQEVILRILRERGDAPPARP